jgi:hypothetical protein
VKATPAFDRELCAYFGVPPLDFDGHHDSMFQQCNHYGNRGSTISGRGSGVMSRRDRLVTRDGIAVLTSDPAERGVRGW